MTPEERGFVRSMAEDPTDDAVRLIFADWLEEREDPRAEFVRLQNRLAHWIPDAQERTALQRRERELLQNETAWLGPFPRYWRQRHWFNGTLWISMEATRFLGNGFVQRSSSWLRRAWVGGVHLHGLKSSYIPTLVASPLLESITSLELDGNGWDDHDLEAFLVAGNRLTLRRLNLANNRLTSKGLRTLLDSPLLSRLYELNLRNNRITSNAAVCRLLTASAPSLRRVELSGNPLDSQTLQKAIAFKAAKPSERPTRLVNSIGMELQLIPAGSFFMGSPNDESMRNSNEGPVHEVTLTQPFFLGVYPVTQQQYRQVMGANPSRFAQTEPDLAFHYPVESVSWVDADEFCRRLSQLPEEQKAHRSYRLPTEAEWEHACRGGTSLTPFCFGETLSSHQANFDGTRCYQTTSGPNLARTTPVGLYKQHHPFGLHDMYGNVWEWCNDYHGNRYYHRSPRRDPQGPKSGDRRVVRGGSWYFYGQVCRTAFRGRASETAYREAFAGLRVAMNLGEPNEGG